MYYLISAVTGYMLGSIPTAYIVIKRTKGLDITATGSGNVGARNSYEITDSKITGIFVLSVDALKGLLSVYLTMVLCPVNFVFPALALLFAVFSHCYNPWLGFNGGRGLATSLGGAILIFPYILFVWILLWVIIYAMKRDILLANIWANFMTVVLIFTTSDIAFKYTYPTADSISSMLLFSTALMLMIIIRHVEPLKELINSRKISRMDGKNEKV
jgi:glycerol-3-phosphate acyltransferase PlsY